MISVTPEYARGSQRLWPIGKKVESVKGLASAGRGGGLKNRRRDGEMWRRFFTQQALSKYTVLDTGASCLTTFSCKLQAIHLPRLFKCVLFSVAVSWHVNVQWLCSAH